jgi:hypothetical protein
MEYWLQIYSPAEILQAISQMPGKEFYGDIPPTALFRRSLRNGEKADHIGSLLNGNTRKVVSGGIIESWERNQL